ncbi:MAG: prepilin-type N-terminal cleavage/methylation domain-containing protein [Atopobiaceae bacterium]|nr:prepilin-type N-terminal cleavage/methylation domain-containing protein [Atopobiaceae bacterium]
MLDILKARKEALEERGNKGFTLAELLIVVAIIAVLVAIAIPVFTTQLERSREATDISNVRAAYAEATADYLATGAKEAKTATAPVQQKEAGWQMGADQAVIHSRVNGTDTPVSIPAKTSGQYTVTVAADGTVSVS